mgnify:CR=1 FL=1|jgi:hypothetical protein
MDHQILESEAAQQLQDKYDLLIEGNHAVFGEQAVGGGICAKPKIDELIKSHHNKIKGVKKAATAQHQAQQM